MWTNDWQRCLHHQQRPEGGLAYVSAVHWAPKERILIAVGCFTGGDGIWGVDLYQFTAASTLVPIGGVRDDAADDIINLQSSFDPTTSILYVVPPGWSSVLFFSLPQLLTIPSLARPSSRRGGDLEFELQGRDSSIACGSLMALKKRFAEAELETVDEEAALAAAQAAADAKEEAEAEAWYAAHPETDESSDEGSDEDSDADSSDDMPSEKEGLKEMQIHSYREMDVESLWHLGEGLGGGSRIRRWGYSDYIAAFAKALRITRQQLMTLTATNKGSLGFWEQFLSEEDLLEIAQERRRRRRMKRWQLVARFVGHLLCSLARSADRLHAPDGPEYKRSRDNFYEAARKQCGEGA